MERSQMEFPYQSIAPMYGIKPRRVTVYPSLYRSEAAYRLETEDGDFVIKTCFSYKRAKQAYRCVKKLQKAGFADMPRWHIAQSGDPIIRKNGACFFVADWIEGERMGANERDSRELGRVLGRLHRTSRLMLMGKTGRSYTAMHVAKQLKDNRSFRRRLPDLRKQESRIGQWFRQEGDLCLQLMGQATKLLGKSDVRNVIRREKAAPAVIHGDVTRPNAIRSGDKLALIDWERARLGSVYHELAKALRNTTDFSVPLMGALLKGYEEVRHLSGGERLLVSALFRMPIEVWRVASFAAAGKKSDLFNIVETTWSNRLAAVEWVSRWAENKASD